MTNTKTLGFPRKLPKRSKHHLHKDGSKAKDIYGPHADYWRGQSPTEVEEEGWLIAAAWCTRHKRYEAANNYWELCGHGYQEQKTFNFKTFHVFCLLKAADTTPSPRELFKISKQKKDWSFYWTFSLTLLTLWSIWHCLLTLEYNHYQQLFHIHNYWLFSVREACTRRFRFVWIFSNRG